MTSHLIKIFVFFLFGIIVFLTSCRKDTAYFEGKANYFSSTDTLLFDTVFTQTGSATRSFKIYNKEKNPILIDIKIKNSTSFFRMNVDGYKGSNLKGIEVPANDSIYVFVETTISPDQPLSVSPFFVEDQVIITQNNEENVVHLIAYGQNANYIPQVNAKGFLTVLSCDLAEVVWNDAKPYVIYGILIIDSCTLTIPAGARVYVHGGVVVNDNQVYNDGQIIVLDNGRINIEGSAEQKVIIEGDRLEPEYNDVAGQWGGIRIFKNSKGNRISNAILRNAIVGISVDSAATLELHQTSIENPAAYGIFAIHSEINGSNIQVYGSGSHSIALTYGGNYRFDYCTFYSDQNEDESILFNNYTCYNADCSIGDIFTGDVLFRNCIISGASADEILLDPANDQSIGTTFFYRFENCAVRVNEILDEDQFPNFMNDCESCISLNQNDIVFVDRYKYDLRLDSASVVLGKAKVLNEISVDILGKNRDMQTPDMGCFEN